jgi:hypothetical protein
MRRRAAGRPAAPAATARRAAPRRQRRQHGQRLAQAGQLARAHLAQRDACRDAFDIADPRSASRSTIEAIGEQLRWLVAHRGRRAVAQRLQSSTGAAPAAHAGAATVQQRQQRRRVLAAQRLHQLEVAVRRRRQLQQARWRASTVSVRTCASAWPCVCSAKLSSAAAAACASARSCALKPASVATCSCAHSLRRPSAASNCQAGRAVSAARPADSRLPAGRGRRAAARRRPAGPARTAAPPRCIRSSPAARWPGPARPGRSAIARGTAPAAACRLRSASSSVSVMVPGVTTRTTLRSTGPLAVATSPTCSAIATASPSLISRAR